MRDDNDISSNSPGKPDELLSELGSIKELLDEELEQPRAAPATSIEEIGSVEEYLRLKQAADTQGLSIESFMAQQAEELKREGLELVDVDDESIPILDEVVPIDEEEEPESPPQDGDALLMELAEEEGQHAPSTAEATTVEEYFAAVAAAKHREPTPQPFSSEAEPQIPLLDEVVEEEESIALSQKPSLLEEIEALDAIPTLEEVVDEEETAIPVLDELAEETLSNVDEEGVSLDDMQEMVDLIVNRKLQQLRPELEKEVMAELQKLVPISALSKS